MGALMQLSEKDLKKPLRTLEWAAIMWYMVDALTHFVLEGSYLYLAMGTTAAHPDAAMPWAIVWREYGKADKRWAGRDANVIALEFLTVFGAGPICLLLIYGIWYKKPWRHVLQVILCTAELYGGWMTFCPEWVEGSPNLVTDDPVYLWIYLVFMNGLWVWVPILLLVDSCLVITRACAETRSELTTERAEQRSNFGVTIIVSIVVYSILVPAVLMVKGGSNVPAQS
uniref:EXPERA domain-containing protein n=1 Tax=Palpitomonas bilix TaxID=652834 RepID=A0A7S3DH16_9EUKA